MARYLSTGCGALDELLGGGFLRRRINTIYGDAGTGKTTLILQVIADLYREGDDGQAFFYLDTEGGLCYERLEQLAAARGI
ncbi:TPA: DNA repair protein RadB, partial [Candidatus Bathyarchaeota archaeon]|nr:DNA repair protein RadB [Candidatus Bathyarchaeota archaeon]